MGPVMDVFRNLLADALALQGAEVGVNSRVLEVHHSGEGLVEEAADGEHGEVARFGLEELSGGGTEGGQGGVRTARVWILY